MEQNRKFRYRPVYPVTRFTTKATGQWKRVSITGARPIIYASRKNES